MGRAGHGAHQGPLRRHHARPARGDRRARRGVLGRDPARHHAPGRPAPLRPHRRHPHPHAPAGRRGHHHPGGLRQRRAQPHRLPAGRGLPHRGLRHDPLRRRALPLPARPPRLPGLRAQVQAGVLGLRGRGLRPGDDARLRRHRPPVGRRRRRAAGVRHLRRRRPRHDAPPGEALRGPPGRGAAPDGPGDRARLRPPRREAEPQPRAHQVPRRQAGHRRVRRLVDEERALLPTTSAGPPTCPTSRTSPSRRCASRWRSPRTAPATPRATPSGPARTSTASASRVRRGHDRPAAGRHQLRADPQAGRGGPPLRGRHRADDGRAEHRAALGGRERPPRPLRRPGGDRPGRPRGRDDRRRDRPPGDRHLQARHRLVARAGRRAAHLGAPSSSSTRPCAACASR